PCWRWTPHCWTTQTTPWTERQRRHNRPSGRAVAPQDHLEQVLARSHHVVTRRRLGPVRVARFERLHQLLVLAQHLLVADRVGKGLRGEAADEVAQAARLQAEATVAGR